MQKIITLAHGSGGRLMHELIDSLRIQFSNRMLNELSDAAEFNIERNRLAFSTDSYVVKPLFFPGGDIGKLAVCGTVNDISMKGAKPLFISLAFIIEEGFELAQLERIASSIEQEAKRAKVYIVTGDIKVVETGAVDKIFINTAGIGEINYSGRIGVKAKPKDLIVINGGIAEHGMAILNARERLGFTSNIKSDCRSLNFEVQRCLAASKTISIMRDLTRGGLATVLNEIANSSNLGIEICEQNIPIKSSVKKMCDVLGFDPLYVANEGKFVCFVSEKDASKIKQAIGKEAKIIGKVTLNHKKEVYLKTRIGSSRMLPILESDQLPRIC
jgi:hydrogenase expression/formation protein HypE